MTRRSLVAPALLAAIAVAGCGGSKELSRSELVAKADPICERANHKFDSSKVTSGTVGRLGPEIAAYEKQAATELAKLTPPTSMRHDWRVIVGGFQTTGESMTLVAEYARAKKYAAALPSIGRLTSAQHNRAVAALHDGFKECSKY